MRRHNLVPLPDDKPLPVPKQTKLHRRKPLAEYDVRLVERETVSDTPTDTATPGTVMTPSKPLSHRFSSAYRRSVTHCDASRVIINSNSLERKIAHFPYNSDMKPALLTSMEKYIKEEKRGVEEATGKPLVQGCEMNYHIHRNALNMLKGGIKSYEPILSVIIRELDFCFKTIFDNAGESERLRQELLDEKYARDMSIGEMERTHKSEISAILKDVKKTKLDNLLSVEVSRKDEAARKLEEQLEGLKWEVAQLMDTNYELKKQNEQLRQEADMNPLKQMTNARIIPKHVDSFILSLSSSLMSSLNLIKTLKVKNLSHENDSEIMTTLENENKGLKETLSTLQHELALVREEVSSVGEVNTELTEKTKALKIELSSHSREEERNEKKSKLKQEVLSLKEANTQNKKMYKQSLLDLYRQLSFMEKTSNQPGWQLLGRPIIPEGCGANVSPLLRTTSVTAFPAEGYTGKLVTEDIEAITLHCLYLPKLSHILDPQEAKGGMRKKSAVANDEPIICPDIVGKAEVIEAIFKHFGRKYGFAKEEGVGLGRLNQKGQGRLMNFMVAIKRYDHHADCYLLNQVLQNRLSPDLWVALRKQSILFKRQLTDLAQRYDPHEKFFETEHSEKGDNQRIVTSSREAKVEIIEIIRSVAPFKTIDNAMNLFLSICPLGVVPPDFKAYLQENIFTVTEVLKAQYIEETRLFILQIEECLRAMFFAEPEKHILTKSAIEAIMRIDPKESYKLVERAVYNSCPEGTEENVKENDLKKESSDKKRRKSGEKKKFTLFEDDPEEDTADYRITDIEAFLDNLRAAHPWHSHTSSLNRDILQDLTTLEVGSSAPVSKANKEEHSPASPD